MSKHYPIRELLITAKIWLALLYTSGYLSWGYYYETQAQQVGRCIDFLPPLEVCFALSYTIKARKLCHWQYPSNNQNHIDYWAKCPVPGLINLPLHCESQKTKRLPKQSRLLLLPLVPSPSLKVNPYCLRYHLFQTQDWRVWDRSVVKCSCVFIRIFLKESSNGVVFFFFNMVTIYGVLSILKLWCLSLLSVLFSHSISSSNLSLTLSLFSSLSSFITCFSSFTVCFPWFR